jgi:23S rRNA pseudouridine2605 synthase
MSQKSSKSSSKKDASLIRLNKYISSSGIFSIREADMYISIGNNGQW